MDLQQNVEYRNVRRVRLEIGRHGVRLILPNGYPEKPEVILNRHRRWIESRLKFLQTAVEQVDSIHISRTEQQLRIIVRNAIDGSFIYVQKTPLAVRFRKMRTRWGTCNSAGVITLSKNLKHLPEELVEYVVHHEMCHLAEMSHGKAFWLLVASRYPDYRNRERELKMHGLVLQ